MVYLALTYDHRLVDGADAARFLTDVKQRLETGSSRSERALPRRRVASGFLGYATWSRRLRAQTATRCGSARHAVRRPAPRPSPPGTRTPAPRPDGLEAADVVVNLAGTPTVGNPHSSKWARSMRESRVRPPPGAGRGDRAHGEQAGVPRRNGIGYYGDHGDEVITEESDSRGDALLTACPATGRRPPTRPSRRAPASACCGPHRCMDRTSAAAQAACGCCSRPGSARGSATAASTSRSSRCATGSAAVIHLAEHDDRGGPFNLCCPEHADQRRVHRRPGPGGAPQGVPGGAGSSSSSSAPGGWRPSCWARSTPGPPRSRRRATGSGTTTSTTCCRGPRGR